MSDGSPVERPVIYKVDVRVWLREESARERRPVTLDSLPPSTLDALADLGFRWIWLVGVWETGTLSRDVHRRNSASLETFQQALPDVTLSDISGSPHAVIGYTVAEELGGDEGLDAFRTDLARRDMRLIVDFAASRVGMEHPWVTGSPEFLLEGDEALFAQDPSRYHRTPDGRILTRALDLADRPLHDALALNPRHPGLRRELLAEIAGVATRADGIRFLGPAGLLTGGSADAAGSSSAGVEFWAEALPGLRARAPHVLFLADEQPGLREAIEPERFDYYLNETLVELLATRDAPAVRSYLQRRGGLDASLVGLLERLGGRRCAETFPDLVHPAAAVVAYLTSGAALFLDGQLEGHRRRQCPELARRAVEVDEKELQSFYETLLEILGRPEVAKGSCSLLPVCEGWEGNTTWQQFVVVLHRGAAGQILLTAVNYGPARGQCYVDVSCLEASGYEWTFQDLLSLAVYPRDGNELEERGLYLDLGPWDYNVFEVVRGKAL